MAVITREQAVAECDALVERATAARRHGDGDADVAALVACLAHPCAAHEQYLPELWGELASADRAQRRFDEAIDAWEQAIDVGYRGVPHPQADIAERDAGFIAVAGGSLWLTVPPPDARFTQELWRIDPASGDVLARVSLGPDPVPPFVAGDYLWIVTAGDQRLTRINIDSLEVVPVDVERFPWTLTAADGSMWIGHHVLPKVRRLTPTPWRSPPTSPWRPIPGGSRLVAGGCG